MSRIEIKSRVARAAAWSMTVALFFHGSWARASGLRTQFGEVKVEGLKIGQTYSLHKLLNLPYRVVNTGEEEVDLRLEMILVSSSSIKEGYEQAPDLSWVSLEKLEHMVAPNHEAVSDVLVSIPNDPALLGRRFQANIWARTQSRTEMVAVAMLSRLLMHVDSTPPTGDELKAKFLDRRVANLDFTVHPTGTAVDNIPLGREVDLKKERKVAINLINPNDEKLTFRVRSVPNWEAKLARPPGFTDAYNPHWLKPAQEIVEMPGNSLREVSLLVHVPAEPQYYGMRFLFAVAIDVLEQEIPVRVYYRLAATTQSQPIASPAPAEEPTQGKR